MKKTKIVVFALVLITILLSFSSCFRFHFITDPCKLDWGINHYYVLSGEINDEGNKEYILYSHEVTLINPFHTAKITDTTLGFGDNNTVTFVDLNGNVHKGTYEVEGYSKEYFDYIVMNFDDGISIATDYFELKRDKVTNHYIVFSYDDVEYVFSTMHALGEKELVQKRAEMVEWARKLNDGYKRSEEEKYMDFFIIKGVWLGGYPLKYRNGTSSSDYYPSTIEQLKIEDGKIEFYCKRKEMNDGWKSEGVRVYENSECIYILIDKDNNIRELEEPTEGDCLYVSGGGVYHFYFFE